jgi:hypothetical protein
MSRDLVLVDTRHRVGLVVVLGCGWCLQLQLQKLLLESGDHLRPLLKLGLLRLDDILEMHDRVGPGVHLLPGEVQLLVDVVSRMLGLTEATVCDLQLLVLI